MYQNDKEEKDVVLETHLFSISINKGREQIGMLHQNVFKGTSFHWSYYSS